MNAAPVGSQRLYPPGVGAGGTVGDLPGVDDAVPVPAAVPAPAPLAPDLLAEDAPAQPDQAALPDPVLAMVHRVLGAQLTTDNLAWRGDPVPVMRSLQKMLVAHSLTLADGQRAPALHAIRAVELAVALRLRWMQMRRSEAESHFIAPQEDHAQTPQRA